MNLTTLPENHPLRLAINEAIQFLRGWGGKIERPHRMAQLILNEQPEVVVEIGVFGGQSLIPQAMALKWTKQGRIYGIDPYNLDVILEQMAPMDGKDMWLRQNMDTVLYDTRRAINNLGLLEHATLILGRSKDCSKLFDTIDILHIDGAHTEEGALLDVNLYAKRVRKGGHIWMDDTHFDTLQPALKELATCAELLEDWGGYQLWRHK